MAPVFDLTDCEVIRKEGYPTFVRYPDGYPHPLGFPAQRYYDTKKYEFQEEDIIVATYPKSGTTWTENIVYLLLHEGEGCDKDKTLFERCFFLDMDGLEVLNNALPPKILKTHIPVDQLQFTDKGKWVVVMRNPKDAAVSYYHHCRGFKMFEFSEGKWDNFFEYFMEGKVGSGDYFDWNKTWFPYLKNENVCFMLYEDMIADREAAVRKIAKFLGGKALEAIEDPAIFAKVMENQSLKKMKENVDKIVHAPLLNIWKKDGPGFIRKGTSGDWRNNFTKEQSDIMDARYKRDYDGTVAENWWKDEMKWQ